MGPDRFDPSRACEIFLTAGRRGVCEMRDAKLAGVGFLWREAGEYIDTCS